MVAVWVPPLKPQLHCMMVPLGSEQPLQLCRAFPLQICASVFEGTVASADVPASALEVAVAVVINRMSKGGRKPSYALVRQAAAEAKSRRLGRAVGLAACRQDGRAGPRAGQMNVGARVREARSEGDGKRSERDDCDETFDLHVLMLCRVLSMGVSILYANALAP